MSTFDQEVMARTAIGEARNQGQEGMVAVMWTGMNRFSSKKWFSALTLAGVFMKRTQYSCWTPENVNFAYIINIADNIGLFRDALAWAAQIIIGGIADPTMGATHYKVAGTPADWAEGKTPCITIGKHEFYNNID